MSLLFFKNKFIEKIKINERATKLFNWPDEPKVTLESLWNGIIGLIN